MVQLPRVAVVGTGLSSVLALAALVDGGLDAQGVCSADLEPNAVDVLSTRGLEGRLRRVEAVARFAWLGGGDGGGPFEIVSGGERIGRFDAVVVANSGMAADPDGVGSPSSGSAKSRAATQTIKRRSDEINDLTRVRTPGPVGRAGRFGGVFDPDSDGVYLIGGAGPVGGRVHGRSTGSSAAAERDTVAVRGIAAERDTVAVRELAWAQGSWVGEYLRGRYQLPPRSVMLAHPGLPRRRFGWERPGIDGYLARLGRELRRGRARAAAAGYPLPLPSSAAPPMTRA
jgi:hypothetical protein